jgi:hypothetical protein
LSSENQEIRYKSMLYCCLLVLLRNIPDLHAERCDPFLWGSGRWSSTQEHKVGYRKQPSHGTVVVSRRKDTCDSDNRALQHASIGFLFVVSRNERASGRPLATVSPWVVAGRVLSALRAARSTAPDPSHLPPRIPQPRRESGTAAEGPCGENRSLTWELRHISGRFETAKRGWGP